MKILIADKFEQAGIDGLKALGAEGLIPPITLSCRDHEGGGGVKFQQCIHIKLSTPRKLLWHYRVATHTIMPASKELPDDDHTTGGPCHA